MRRVTATVLALSCLGLSGCADRPPSSPFAGTWVTMLADHPFIVVTVRESAGAYSGELVRPAHFTTSDFVRFTGMGPDVVTESISHADVRGGRLHFTVSDPRDAGDTTEYEMWRDSDQGARIRISDVAESFEPLRFTRRSGSTPTVFTGWEPGCQYRVGELKASSREMHTMFEADQDARKEPGQLSAAEWAVIERRDADRRTRTRELLTRGLLSTADDFRWAAFIFQHGSSPEDYLLAHTLATVAVTRGDTSATWIATATLDRYLQAIGKSQIYGTQFKPTPDATQEPFDRALIPDTLRRELGVPALAAQLLQQQDYAKQFRARE